MFWKKSKEIEQLYKGKRKLLEQLETEKHKSAYYFTKAEELEKSLSMMHLIFHLYDIENDGKHEIKNPEVLDEIEKLKKAGDL